MSPGVIGYPPAPSSWPIPFVRYPPQTANGLTAHLYGGYQSNGSAFNGAATRSSNGGTSSLTAVSSSNGNNSTSSDRATTRSTSSQSPPNSAEHLSRTNLYIRGLGAGTTDKDLLAMCQQHGKIVSTKAILDKATNQCKGYGFVDFDCPESAEAAVKALQDSGIQAQMARVRQQDQDPTNLYLANLPSTWTETNLETLLAPHGPVTSTRILRTANGHSRGVGFARMDSRETCERIIAKFNGQPVPGLTVEPLLVKFADSGKKNKQAFMNTNFDALSISASEPYAAVSPYVDQAGVYQNGNVPTLFPPSMQGYMRGAFNSGQICYIPAIGHPYAAAAYLPFAVPPMLHNQSILGYSAAASAPGSVAGDSAATAAAVNALAAQLSHFSIVPTGAGAVSASAAAGFQLQPAGSASAAAVAAAYQAAAAAQYQPHFVQMPYAVEQAQDRFNNNDMIAQAGSAQNFQDTEQ